MAPHPDLGRVGLRILLDGRDRVEHVDGVIGLAVRAARLTLGSVVAAIVDAEDDIAAARQPIDVSDVALGGHIHSGRDVAVVEDNRRKTAFWLGTVWHSQQPVNLEALRQVIGVEALVVAAGL